MRFTAVAVLAASAAGAAASADEPMPYRLAVRSVPGQGLFRRNVDGYKPETLKCNLGDTCGVACGQEFSLCPASEGGVSHCFNPSAGESCCTDGSGNSCEKGYYCTHDRNKNSWCCPETMDIATCAAKYHIADGLEQATAKPPAPSTTAAPSFSSNATTTQVTTICSTTSTPASNATTFAHNTTAVYPSSAWPSASAPSGNPVPQGLLNVSGAAASGVSGLLLAAAAAVALL
ncbi:hypothetical protein DCS_00479 [Drechmeria coniospora]|uniref:Prp 4 CRoW domain-containing protein n=1 Tax=Drechmeria coniospora TaxID=98403 RepID=A0A151GQG9_DRECN|nr:hypothetical protein DCS_00479 [Drechmeria coniospora]KYK59349.1 hypothetical protein DCS_00479 [Drechmeria coniospora]ODA77680.1 hypothetical protein RJ55_06282 [Drechmeria coniospora]